MLVFLTLFLAMACVYDYGRRRIPNLLVAGMLAVGMIRNMCRSGPPGVLGGLGASGLVLLIFYLFFKIGVLGAGDVKLLAVCAEYISWHKLSVFLFVTFLVATLFSLIKMIRMKNILERLEYLGQYLLTVALCGHWQLYIQNKKEEVRNSVCLAGPVLISAILCWGGIY